MDSTTATIPAATEQKFVRGLGLLDSTMLVAGSMIGSGIFIVSSIIARQVGAPGWLLVVWIVTGVLTLMAALSYGELAAMMPKAGGQYVYLREAFSPLWGFLYGWTLFLVIQTGTVAAVSVGFAKFLGVLWPKISVDNYIVAPIRITSGYAISLSTAQLIGVLMIVLLTFMNTRGLRLGKLVQNVFTITKTGSLIALILLGVLLGWNANAVHLNFGNLWHIGGKLQDVGRGLTAAVPFGLFLLANVAYLVTLPIETIKTVPADRVASATVDAIFPGRGAAIMAVAIMISTFGCNNGLILAGARAYYAMARDGLFFKKSGELNHKHVPAWGLIVQGIWAAALVLPRTIDAQGNFGSLYNDLLTYVISAALIFYILTILGIIVLRKKRPDAERPYKAFGYPIVPVIYIVGAAVITIVLFIYQPAQTWPGLAIVATGIPVYFIWKKVGVPMPEEGSISEAAAEAKGEY